MSRPPYIWYTRKTRKTIQKLSKNPPGHPFPKPSKNPPKTIKQISPKPSKFPKPSKNYQKTIPQTLQIPKTLQKPSQNFPKTLPKFPNRKPEGGRPKAAHLFGGFGEGFWRVLGWFLEGFGNLEGLGDGFLIVFGGFGEFGGFG